MGKVTDRVILLFSGGRDSILSVKRLSNMGYKDINLLTCDNGHIENLKYARENTEFIKISNASLIQSKPIMYDLLKIFANMRKIDCEMCQIICLCCRASMIVCAIAAAKKMDISTIAVGDRVSDPYIFNTQEIKNIFDDFCNDHDIDLIRPVYDVDSNHDRIVELAEYGIYPKVLEPKCWIGYEPDRSNNDLHMICDYFNAYMIPIMNKHIERIIR